MLARRHFGPLLLAPAAIFLCAFFLYPVARIVWMSISEPHFGVASYAQFFSEPLYLRVMGRTFLVAAVVTVACALLAYPLAYAMAHNPRGLGTLLLAAVALSFWTSYLVRAYAWMIILGSRGPVVQALDWIGIAQRPKLLYSATGMYVGLTHALLPYMVLTIYTVMKRIDPQYMRAAANLGARPLYSFLTVYLPLSAPGVVNGCTLVFVFCLGFYVTPALLGGPGDVMLPGLIGQQLNQTLDWGLAGAMTTVLIASTLIVLSLYNRLFGLNRLWH